MLKNRRLAWLLGLTLTVAPARGQEPKIDAPRPEAPRAETPAASAPVAVLTTAPIADAFIAPAATRQNVNGSVEFLLYWYKRDQIPSLLNTAVETDTLFAGTLLDPMAKSLIGTDQTNFGSVPGIRATLGFAMTETIDLELGGFLMESRAVGQTYAGTNGQPFLTRPFYNQHDLVEGGFDTSSKSGISGNLGLLTRNELYGYEANAAFFVNIPDSPVQKITLGFRQITMAENMTVIENVSANGPGFLAYYPTVDARGQLVNANFDPTTQAIRIVDSFATRNEFYGPQAGAQFRWSRGGFAFDFLPKLAFGVNRETIRVNGLTNRLTNGVVTDTGAGGLLAVSTNSGNVVNNEIAVVPEIGLKLNFAVSNHLSVNFGYDVLYLSSVARPGNQIDRRINPQYVPSDVAYNPGTTGPIAPRPFFRDTDFFAQGLTFGFVVSY